MGHLFWKHGGAARAEQVLGGKYRPRSGFCIQRGQHIDDVRIFVDEVCARVSRAATVWNGNTRAAAALVYCCSGTCVNTTKFGMKECYIPCLLRLIYESCYIPKYTLSLVDTGYSTAKFSTTKFKFSINGRKEGYIPCLLYCRSDLCALINYWNLSTCA